MVSLMAASVLVAAAGAAAMHSAAAVTSTGVGDAGGAYALPPPAPAPSNSTSTPANVDRIDNRTWASSPQDAIRHDNFESYVKYLAGSNVWNQQRSKEYIAAYNVETEIGRYVNAYEIASLAAKIDVLAGTANHTPQQEKFYRWAFEKYTVPNSTELINQRLTDIVGSDKLHHVPRLAAPVDSMVNAGGVPEDVDVEDGEFWSKTRLAEYCMLASDCDLDVWAMTDRPGGVTPVTTYGRHTATIHLVYEPCSATMPSCSDFERNIGSGIQSQAFPSQKVHIQDPLIFVRLTNYGHVYDRVVATAQLTGPGHFSNTVTVYDDDGYVNDSGYLRNQNARSESAVYVTFKSYSYAP